MAYCIYTWAYTQYTRLCAFPSVVPVARDESRGLEAVRQLKEEQLDAQFHQLDITDTDSIARLKEFLQTKYQGLDLLVNNAGFAYKVHLREDEHVV